MDWNCRDNFSLHQIMNDLLCFSFKVEAGWIAAL